MTWLFILIAYLLGCIPFGLIVAKVKGVDLRAAGSGNIGATNALRVMGKGAGAVTLIGDVLKGAAAVYLALRFAGRDAGFLAAVAAVIGHDYPVTAGFRGGKGVATSFGVLFMLEPIIAVTGFTAWLVTVLIWRVSSLGALVSFSLMPVFVILIRGSDRGLFTLSVILTALIIFKHKDNIARLIKGEEKRLGQKT